jgi:hypothetical protein
VARQVSDTARLAGGQPQRAESVVLRDELDPEPALRAIWPPRPGLSSTLCTMVPVEFSSGRALPGLMSAFGPTPPSPPPRGVPGEDVGLLAVGVRSSAIRADRFVVLDRSHLRRDAVLAALEVDDPVAPLVPRPGGAW